MSPDLIHRLRSTGDVLMHYAPLHSLLADWGKPLEAHLSEWIVAHPDAYQEALTQSFEAGCDLASTSTQASSPWRAEVFGLRERVHELNYKSASLAREVMPKDRYLAGFVSITNPDFLEPAGDLTADEVYDGYKEQISALLEGGADLIMIVGNQLDTGMIAIKVAKDIADVPVIAQNVYYAGAKGFRTMMGYDPATGTARLAEAGADVVGASCGLMREGETTRGHTHYYEAATELVRQMKDAFDGLISIQPNAGMARLVDGVTVYPATPDEMAAEVGSWMDAGARIVGGCCGTSLEHYRRVSPIVRRRNAEVRKRGAV